MLVGSPDCSSGLIFIDEIGAAGSSPRIAVDSRLVTTCRRRHELLHVHLLSESALVAHGSPHSSGCLIGFLGRRSATF